jgi:sugar phosphate permease
MDLVVFGTAVMLVVRLALVLWEPTYVVPSQHDMHLHQSTSPVHLHSYAAISCRRCHPGETETRRLCMCIFAPVFVLAGVVHCWLALVAVASKALRALQPWWQTAMCSLQTCGRATGWLLSGRM